MNAESPLIGLSLRQPPANPMAEQALLGAILFNNRAYGMVADFLKPEHFADPLHGLVYEAIEVQINWSVAHSYSGDLVIELISPSGMVSYLLDRAGGAAMKGSAGR